MTTAQAIWKKVVLLAVISVLTVAIAGPAAAAESGSGVVTTGTWSDETANEAGSPLAPCGGRVTSSAHSWSHTTTSTLTVNNGGVTYTGPSTVDLTSDADYWFDQQGSYENAGCAQAMNNPVGYDVPATASLSGTNGSDTVSCSTLSGTFDRTNVTVVTVTMTGSCTVTLSGQSGVSSTSTIDWTLDVPLNPVTFEPFIAGGSYDQD